MSCVGADPELRLGQYILNISWYNPYMYPYQLVQHGHIRQEYMQASLVIWCEVQFICEGIMCRAVTMRGQVATCRSVVDIAHRNSVDTNIYTTEHAC